MLSHAWKMKHCGYKSDIWMQNTLKTLITSVIISSLSEFLNPLQHTY